MSTIQHDETEVCDAGFTAADMATAAAQGFRDGQAVQAAVAAGCESAAAQLRAMATNYPAGHLWDKLDATACIRGALEIEALRASRGQALSAAQAELAAMRAGREPVAEMVPCHTPSGKRVAIISRFQHLPIGTKFYTHPHARLAHRRQP